MQPEGFEKLGHLQAMVLGIIWEQGEATVHEIRNELKQFYKEMSYTAILSTCQRLEKARWIKHRVRNRRYGYIAIKTRNEVLRPYYRLLAKRLFNATPIEIIFYILEREKFNANELDSLEEILDSKHPVETSK